MQRLLMIFWYVAIVVSSIGFLWAVFHNFTDVSMSLVIVNIVLSLVCWRFAARRAKRRRAWQAYLQRFR